ncbi:AMP-binding protein [Ilumatobacter nonamiensis]|uniref:AMP-binding protein n=1 Tax=Ilumatobacter nonamiensis TaxID=467093 RepID=UPI00034AFEF7|nr:AMP-binding protein [Ilumatobacter nonamiensis]
MTERATSLVDLAKRTGLLDPRRIPSLTAATARWGPTIAAPFTASALSSPRGTAIIDDHGPMTFADLDRNSSRLATGLHGIGLARGDRLGLACRNHRDFVEVTVAAAKAGVGVVYLNTSFAAPQMAEVLAREDIAAVAIDAELLHLVDTDSVTLPIIVTARSGDDLGDLEGRDLHTLTSVRGAGSRWRPLRASLPVPPVLLTSGTTGTPKGAQRSNRVDPSGAASVIDRIPYRYDDIVGITSPLFHAWGLAQLALASTLGATVALTTTFDAETTLAQIERERITVLAVVPAIIQRLLASASLDSTDLSSLRVVASSGSALPVPVVEEWFDRVGPNLYNLYGSTEVGQATLATPDDLAAEPATAGRPLAGSTIAILDDSGNEIGPGAVGRIFVGNGAQFDRYTGGGGKEIVDGLMASGDVGYLTPEGLLFVTGRADDMIVSGGENVFPQEIEDLLLTHPEISDVAIVAVDDDDFGQRFAAYVVKPPGSRLSSSAVKQWVGDQLARHKTPRDVHFVDALPRTETGKIRRNQLG